MSAVFFEALGLRLTPQNITLNLVDEATLERRAPLIVENPGTFDRVTLGPTPGGLFDERLFAKGAFARIVFHDLVPHPLAAHLLIAALPVLPPDYRPMGRRDGELVMSDVNVHYQQVIIRNGRLGRLLQIRAPAPLIDAERAALALAVAALVDNERQPEPRRDDSGRVLTSLLGMLRPDAETAISELDAGELPPRTLAVMFAMGFEVDSASDEEAA